MRERLRERGQENIHVPMNSLIQKSWDASAHRCIQGKRFLCKRNSDRRLGASTEKRFQPSLEKESSTKEHRLCSRTGLISLHKRAYRREFQYRGHELETRQFFPSLPPPCIFHLRDHPFVPGQAITRGPVLFRLPRNFSIKFLSLCKIHND